MKKNRKGQMGGLSVIVVGFIGILIGVIFLQIIAQNVGSSVNTVEIVNSTNAAPANGASFIIADFRALNGVVIHNTTDGVVIAEGNYTVTNNVVTSGALSVQITVDDAEFASVNWNVSATAQPTTYIADGGGRAMANLIIIMFALAVLVVALSPVVQGKMLEMLGN